MSDPISFRLPLEDYRFLKMLAERENTSIQRMARKILLERLRNLRLAYEILEVAKTKEKGEEKC